MESRLAGGRSLSGLAIVASLLFIALAAAAALVALSLAGQIQLLDAIRAGEAIPPGRAQAQDARQRLLGIVELTAGLVAGISLLVWVYRANGNARALGAEGLTYSPGWSVAWFLIPLANLFMPYRVLSELWRASAPAGGGRWRQGAVSPVVGLWWAVCFIRGAIAYSSWPFVTGSLQLADIARLGPNWADTLTHFSWGLLVAEVVEIPACVLSVVVVLSITALQERKRAWQQAVRPARPIDHLS